MVEQKGHKSKSSGEFAKLPRADNRPPPGSLGRPSVSDFGCSALIRTLAVTCMIKYHQLLEELKIYIFFENPNKKSFKVLQVSYYAAERLH